MEADFSGYATKAGLKCTDGRTILPGAFSQQDKMQVPLVWQHGHKDIENVIGHAILENRDDGVYCYGFFNDSPKAAHARSVVEHKDVTMMSIWANELIERSKRVMHGVIREVSLVLSGANPGALIENITIRHSDDDFEVLDEEAIIFTGLEFELEHADQSSASSNEKTVQDVYDSMTEEQQQVLHYMVGEAMASVEAPVKHDNVEDDEEVDPDVAADDDTDVDPEDVDTDALDPDDTDDTDADNGLDSNNTDDNQEGSEMKHNVFEDKDEKDTRYSLTHSDIEGIVADASKNGSLRDAVQGFALAHGINDADLLFPDAKSLDSVPEWIKRRTEWVGEFLSATRKSPFSRIKTYAADITHEEARAKGYITGSLKREEFFSVMRRSTVPTTIYKKQKLDRDDILDITDFDVVAWLKAEMRIMLDEEIARAGLIGDGRDVSHEDKINEGNIRPIAKDHELYTTQVYVNLADASSSIQEFIDAFIVNRSKYRGSGLPTFYTTETYIAQFLMLKDSVGRRIYKNLDELATELRVARVVPVEALEDEPDIIGIAVNPADYVYGATSGGEVNMFDDFDIDYNQQKYLIETRLCGALTKVKSALCFRVVDGGDILVVPAAPAFDAEAGEVTINDTTHVAYHRTDTNAVVNNAGSPYTVASGASLTIVASPTTGYYFATSDDDEWVFTAD